MAHLIVPPRVRNAETFLRRYELMIVASTVLNSGLGIGLLWLTLPHVLVGTLLCITAICAGVAVPLFMWERRAKEARRVMRAWRLVQAQKDAALLAVEARLRIEDRAA